MARANRVWLNNSMIPGETFRIPGNAQGMLFGYNVFEGLRAYPNKSGVSLGIFRLQDHIERLVQSCSLIGMRMPFTGKEMSEAVKTVVRDNGESFAEGCYVRPMVYTSAGEMPMTIRHGFPVQVAIEPQHMPVPFMGKHGVRLGLSEYLRDPRFWPTRAKIGGGYAVGVSEKSRGARLGFDEMLLLNAREKVAECVGHNIFMCKGGWLVTPPHEAGALEGITLQSVLDLAPELGLRPVIRDFGLAELLTADEVGICSTTSEVVRVVEINQQPVKTGELITTLQELFRQATLGVIHPEWLTQVDIGNLRSRSAAL